jgi:hypothetical protein
MQVRQSIIAGLCITAGLGAWALVHAQSLPMEPAHQSGQSITGALEGWFPNPDGTFSILIGYYNRNLKQDIDIPVGPNNKIEPGGPDHGQPTHFNSGRQWGVFTIVVPKDFGTKKYIWTITANGKTTQIPVSLNELWEVSPFVEASGNTPPYISFSEGGPFVNGPKGQTTAMTATVGTPTPLTVYVADDAKTGLGAAAGVGANPADGAATAGGRAGNAAATAGAGAPGATAAPAGRAGRGGGIAATVTWGKFRGPGEVKFEKEKPTMERTELSAAPAVTVFRAKATTTATFSAPGEYLLKVSSNDASGEGGRGFQCCWSNAYVKVTVK